MANVRDLAIRDWKRFSVSAFDLELNFTSPAPGNVQVTVKGIGTNNHHQFETDGQDVMGHLIHVGVHESNIVDENPAYPIRDSLGLVDMRGHRVSFFNSNDTLVEYRIVNSYPDNTVGMLMFDLEFFSTTTTQ